MASESVRERMAEVEKAILDRAPEHDLVPSLDRIRDVAALLGDPQAAFRAVHVTGTNGKTTTVRLTERLLREHGLRTGRFTSPHLVDVRERIAIDGEPLSPEQFVATYDDVVPYVDLVDARRAGEPRMTFFEVLVAMAYAAFADAPVEVAAVEVGMGGTWDATNVLDAQVAVVTPIALDHQRFLGSDVASIAGEKSGIIKPGAVAVLADQQPEAARVLLERCAEVGATVVREGVEFGVAAREIAVGGQVVSLEARGRYDDVFLPLHGEHQAHNAAFAVAAVEALLGADAGLDAEVVRAALADADSPGRLEIVRRGPTVLVDAAHNPAGAAVLADAVRESFTFTRLVGIVGVLADKDAEGILGALEPVLDEVVVTRSRSPRAIDPDELGEIAVDVFGEDRVHVAARLDDAIDVAFGRAEEGGLVGGGVLATGSITLAADVRRLLLR
ncbi:MAG TPA: folylpolyglutamate synthase/dihydrofolate synthase family protein [Kineosporiaceae bacterium]|nr:folylpolyglutamate synthase/dihydrofolate synthase family protein [Kineosporiaceae bacterium]